MTELIQLNAADGTWTRFKDDWRRQCDTYDEDFDEYASGPMALLGELAEKPEARAGVYGLATGGAYEAVCQANLASLPGYDGPVLRIRMMILSPDYDFADKPVEDYARVLVRLFGGALHLSIFGMPAKHLKFHLRSPADRAFFSAVGASLGEAPVFESVQVRGGWLYVTKR